jgi:transposase
MEESSDPIGHLRRLLEEEDLKSRFQRLLVSILRRINDGGHLPARDLIEEVRRRGAVRWVKEWLRDDRAKPLRDSLATAGWTYLSLSTTSTGLLTANYSPKMTRRQPVLTWKAPEPSYETLPLSEIYRLGRVCYSPSDYRSPAYALAAIRNLEADLQYKIWDLRELQRRRREEFARLPLAEQCNALAQELAEGYPFTSTAEIIRHILDRPGASSELFREANEVQGLIQENIQPWFHVLRLCFDLSKKNVERVAELVRCSSWAAEWLLASRAARISGEIGRTLRDFAAIWFGGTIEEPWPASLAAYFDSADNDLLKIAVVLCPCFPDGGCEPPVVRRGIFSFVDILRDGMRRPASTGCDMLPVTQLRCKGDQPMKKRSSSQKSQKPTVKSKGTQERVTIGMDLGDKTSRYCMLTSEGEILREGQVTTSKAGMVERFGSLGRARIAIEVGTHSPWVSRLLQKLGHEMIVANPRQVKLITESSRKDDRLDAQTLARLARVDPQLLRPIRHRSDKAQGALMVIRVRAALIAVRTSLVNTARGLAKSMGERLPKCDADQMGVLQAVSLPAKLRQVLEPLLKEVESLTEKIQDSDREIEQIARKDYPETALLQQVGGVGPLIALTFILTVEDKDRFQKSRDIGCYVGLRPRRSDSGQSQPQLRITKEGDPYLRTMLVQGAHYIISRRGPDTDLKRWGLHLAKHGGKRGKKRAVVAVARKLGILLHRLWVTAEVYEPLRNHNLRQEQKKVAA